MIFIPIGPIVNRLRAERVWGQMGEDDAVRTVGSKLETLKALVRPPESCLAK